MNRLDPRLIIVCPVHRSHMKGPQQSGKDYGPELEIYASHFLTILQLIKSPFAGT